MHTQNICKFPRKITSTSSSPASEYLFDVRPDEERKELPEEQACAFHHTVTQLLFVSGRAHPDIKTPVTCLTTRVKYPGEDDWGKLKRVLQCLRGTTHMKLNIMVENLQILQWWVDAS